jgi:hypothetical protein
LLSNNKAEASARITSVDKKKKKVQIEEAVRIRYLLCTLD